MIIVITIRPGPNMDANPADLVFLISYSPVICVCKEKKFIMRRSAELIRIFHESFFLLSSFRCFALHFDFNNTPPFFTALGIFLRHRTGYRHQGPGERMQVIQPLRL